MKQTISKYGNKSRSPGWHNEQARHSLAAKGIKTGKINYAQKSSLVLEPMYAKKLIQVKIGEKITLLEPIFYSNEFGGLLTESEAENQEMDHSKYPYFKKGTILTAIANGPLEKIEFEDKTGRGFVVDAGFGPRKIKLKTNR